jgi:4-hydroxy-tetrahydrodipicolinate synthase
VKDFTPAYGIVPPLITPFNEDKSIDWDTFDLLVDWHIDRGVSGLFVVCGSSEYWNLTEEEAVQMAVAALKRADGRCNILVGSTMSPEDDLDKNIAQTKRIAETGVDGCFITMPRVLPAEDQLMIDYHMKIHDAVDCPLYAYEMPGGNNYKFSPEAFAEIGKAERYIGIKDTTCDVETVRLKIEACGGSIKIMDANTLNLLDTLKLGATGAITTTSNVAPGLFAKMITAVEKGDLETAGELHDVIVKVDEMMGPGYVMSAKISVAMMGVPMKEISRVQSREFTSERRAELQEMVELIESTDAQYAG